MNTDFEPIAHSLIWACTVAAVIWAIAWGLTSCSKQESDLRAACIQAGGMVLKRAEMNSDCIRITAPNR